MNFDLDALAEEYASRGFVGPIPLISEDLARQVARLVQKESEQSKRLSRLKKILGLPIAFKLFGSSCDPIFATRNRHLDLDMVSKLTKSSSLSTISTKLLHADPVLWRSQVLLQAGTPDTGHSLHRDDYTGIVDDLDAQLSCQIALTESTQDNCMIFLSGSHQLNDDDIESQFGLSRIPLSEKDLYGTSRYKQLSPIAENNIKRIIMKPGEGVFFHPRLIHGSLCKIEIQGTQRSDSPELRTGIVMRITAAGNNVTPKAFAQTLPREDHVVSF